MCGGVPTVGRCVGSFLQDKYLEQMGTLLLYGTMIRRLG
jgi:hypothetical protein